MQKKKGKYSSKTAFHRRKGGENVTTTVSERGTESVGGEGEKSALSECTTRQSLFLWESRVWKVGEEEGGYKSKSPGQGDRTMLNE